MLLAEIQHQLFAHKTIQNAIAGRRVPHAYVFHGPNGVGKEAFALGFAQLLLCEHSVTKNIDDGANLNEIRVGCGVCADCRSVASRTHPDLHLIYRQLGREHPDAEVRKRTALEIGVDVVRHFVIQPIGLTSVRGRAKVFIVREAERMNVEAQNALLKTLEEPAGAKFLILLVRQTDHLLPTTLSRCQEVRFDRLPTDFVAERLSQLRSALPKDQIAWYAAVSEGSVGRALEWVEDDLYAVAEAVLRPLAEINTSHGAWFKSWEEWSKTLGERFRKRGPDVSETEAVRHGWKLVLAVVAGWYGDLLRAAAGADIAAPNPLYASALQRLSTSIGTARAGASIRRIALSERQLDLNVNTQLCMETLVNDLVRLTKSAERTPV